MLANAKELDAMVEGKPYASYIKTILGKVYVRTLNPYTGQEDDLILEGNPKSKNVESCIVDTWSPRDDLYFKRVNKRHLDMGNLIPHVRKEYEIPEETKLNMLSDEDLQKLLSKETKFLTLKFTVEKMTSVAPVYRLLELAKELEKSDKIIKFLEGKLAELQLREYTLEQE